MHDILIRKATIDDIEDLVDFRMLFLKDYKDHPHDKETEDLIEITRKYFEQELPSDGYVEFVAEKDGRIIASSGMEVRKVMPRYGPLSNGRMGYIMNMYTLPEFRRRGLGARLLQCLIDEGKKLDIGLLHLHASTDGAGIYEEAGFKEAELPERILPLR